MGLIEFSGLFGGIVALVGGCVLAYRRTQRGKAYAALYQLAQHLGATSLSTLPAGMRSSKYFVYQVGVMNGKELRVVLRFKPGYLPAILDIEKIPFFKSYERDRAVTRKFMFTITRTAN